MLRSVVIIFCIFTVIACNPIQTASQKKNTEPELPFACLSSQSPCDVKTDWGTFTIDFSGQTDAGKLKTELPFQVQLTFNAIAENIQLKSANGYLEGKTMFMGKIPLFFELMTSSSNIARAQTLLASCSEEVMTWRLWFTVEVEKDKVINKQEFFIDFDSQRL